MSLRLPRFQSGRPLLEEVTADKLNQMVDAIRQCEINSGVGYDVTRGPGGATLTIRQDRGVMPITSGAPYVVGPVNTGIDASGGLISAGTTAYNWTVKKPGSSTFDPIYVFGENNFDYHYNTTSCSSSGYIYDQFDSGINLESTDVARTCGLMTSYQGTIYSHETVSCDNDPLNTYTDVCNNNTYDISAYRSQVSSFSAVGAFGLVSDGCNFTATTGNYTFRCTFNIGSITPSLLKIRFRLRVHTPTSGSTGTVLNILLNNVSISYAPSGTFSTDSGFTETREISSGLKANENTLDFVISHTNNLYWPGIKCQFEPTTYTIVSKDGAVTGGFANLTTAQQDLLGQGTPVQVKISGVDKIYSYNGTGSKTSSGSYAYIRDA